MASSSPPRKKKRAQAVQTCLPMDQQGRGPLVSGSAATIGASQGAATTVSLCHVPDGVPRTLAEERALERTSKQKKLVFSYAIDATKAPSDRNTYRHLRLQNGIHAVLVSVDETEGAEVKAACAVSVGVGQFDDPPEVQGIAHFCEHMLFMGSEKYPGENEHERFLTQNGGYSNAFTEVEQTTYYFECNGSALEKACDITANFFVKPLFNQNAVEREIRAIEHEFRLTQNSDTSRIDQVFAHQCTEGHLYNSFGWGNLESLLEAPKRRGVDLHKAVRDFYEKNYATNKMRVCLVSTQSLDELEKILEATFGQIPIKKSQDDGDKDDVEKKAVRAAETSLMKANQESRSTSKLRCFPPIEDTSLPLFLRQKPVQDTHKLYVSWVLPPTKQVCDYSKPLEVFGHCLGHESKGSVLEYLKTKHLATSLSGGQGSSGFEDSTICTLFNVEVGLTKRGMQQWPEVVEVLLAAMEMLRGELRKVCTTRTSNGGGPANRVVNGDVASTRKTTSMKKIKSSKATNSSGEEPSKDNTPTTDDKTPTAATNKLAQIYSEARLLNNLEFQFQEEERASETAQRLVGIMAPKSGVEVCDVLSGPYFYHEKPDFELIQRYCDLMTVDRLVLGILSSSYGQAARNEEGDEDMSDGDDDGKSDGDDGGAGGRGPRDKKGTGGNGGKAREDDGASSGSEDSEGSDDSSSSGHGSSGEEDEDLLSGDDASRMTQKTASSYQATQSVQLDPLFNAKKAKWEVEPHFGTEFARSKIPANLLRTWKDTKGLRAKYLDTKKIYFPDRNPFIPSDFRLLKDLKGGHGKVGVVAQDGSHAGQTNGKVVDHVNGSAAATSNGNGAAMNGNKPPVMKRRRASENETESTRGQVSAKSAESLLQPYLLPFVESTLPESRILPPLKNAIQGEGHQNGSSSSSLPKSEKEQMPDVRSQSHHVPVLVEYSTLLVPDRLVPRFEKKGSKKPISCDRATCMTPIYRFYTFPKDFEMPKTQVCVRLFPLYHDALAAGDQVALTWLTRALEDRQTDLAYMADVAQLHFSLAPAAEGFLTLQLWGFTQQLPLLFSAILRDIFQFCGDFGIVPDTGGSGRVGQVSNGGSAVKTGRRNSLTEQEVLSVDKSWRSTAAEKLYANGRIEVIRQKLLRKFKNANLDAQVHADRLRQEILVANCHDMESQVRFLDPIEVPPAARTSQKMKTTAMKNASAAMQKSASSTAMKTAGSTAVMKKVSAMKTAAAAAMKTASAMKSAKQADTSAASSSKFNFANVETRLGGGKEQEDHTSSKNNNSDSTNAFASLDEEEPRLRSTYEAFADYVGRLFSLFRVDVLVEGNQDEALLETIAKEVKLVTGIDQRELSVAEKAKFQPTGEMLSSYNREGPEKYSSTSSSSGATSLVRIAPQDRKPEYDERTAYISLYTSCCQKIDRKHAILCVQKSHDDSQKNTCVQIYFQFERTTATLAAGNELLADLLYEPLFNELRTKQQLGYSASCCIRDSYGVQGFLISIASSTHSASELVKRTFEFVRTFDIKKEIGEECVEDVRKNTAKKLLEPNRNMTDLAAQHWYALTETRSPRWQYDRELADGLKRADVYQLWDAVKKSEKRIVTAVLSAATGKKLKKIEEEIVKELGSGGTKVEKHRDSRKFWQLKKSRDPDAFYVSDLMSRNAEF
ncbi:unnamed protein product [Amoebophrya sp. A25]|nr:unnamed protein product [Amoebophrya sp. A25]|eukprot:GSA25T00003121001.1